MSRNALDTTTRESEKVVPSLGDLNGLHGVAQEYLRKTEKNYVSPQAIAKEIRRQVKNGKEIGSIELDKSYGVHQTTETECKTANKFWNSWYKTVFKGKGVDTEINPLGYNGKYQDKCWMHWSLRPAWLMDLEKKTMDVSLDLLSNG